MTSLEPSGKILGATVHDIDLSQPLGNGDFAASCARWASTASSAFPISASRRPRCATSRRASDASRARSRANSPEPGMPEVGILSNVVENGQPIGLADAGQDWHTDMSYNQTIGFLNVLYAVKVPRRGDQVLGATAFADMGAAYDELSPDLKAATGGRHRHARLQQVLGDDAHAAGQRSRSTDDRSSAAAARLRSIRCSCRTRSPVARSCIAIRATRCASTSSIQLKASACWRHCSSTSSSRSSATNTRWSEGDVLMWDHIRTIHMAVADYGPDEPRLMKRCQVMADRIFEPSFMQSALASAAV